jgi:hypothetical protein
MGIPSSTSPEHRCRGARDANGEAMMAYVAIAVRHPLREENIKYNILINPVAETREVSGCTLDRPGTCNACSWSMWVAIRARRIEPA